MLGETDGINNTVSCSKEAVQFSASYVTSLFARFSQNMSNGNEFCIFFIQVTLVKMANAPFDRSVALVLSIIN